MLERSVYVLGPAWEPYSRAQMHAPFHMIACLGHNKTSFLLNDPSSSTRQQDGQRLPGRGTCASPDAQAESLPQEQTTGPDSPARSRPLPFGSCVALHR